MEVIRRFEQLDSDGELYLHGLPYKKGDRVELIVLGDSQQEKLTAKSLKDSGLVGLWSDRKDITDSRSYARQLRKQAETRQGQ